MKAKLARLFLNILVTSLTVFTSYISAEAAQDVVIFSVVRNLQLKPTDPVYKDYYINGGSEDGYRVGSVVTVVRRLPAHDIYRNKALGDVTLPVAKLKLIYVQKQMSIGRIIFNYDPKNIPNLGFEAVMIGDRVVAGEGYNFGDLDMGEEAEGKKGSQTGETQGQDLTDQSKNVVNSNSQELKESSGSLSNVANPIQTNLNEEVKPTSARAELPEKKETTIDSSAPDSAAPRKREPSSQKSKTAPSPDSVQIGPNA